MRALPHVICVLLAGALLGACETELHNNPPEMPAIPTGPDSGQANLAVTFTASSRDPDGARVMIRFDWGDGAISDWSEPVANGTPVSMEHHYFTGGTYAVRAIARDMDALESLPSGVAHIRITGTGIAGRGDWWMDGHDAQHTRRSALPGPALAQIAWTYQTGGKIFSSPVIGLDSTIYVGSDDFHLHALFPDGRRRWSYNAGSDMVRCAPAIGTDGTLYIVSSDGLLHAVSPGGGRLWVYTMEPDDDPDGRASSPVIDANGVVYVGDCGGSLHAVNPDGRRRWRTTISGRIIAGPALAADGTIVFGSDNHVVYALRPDGSIRWTYGVNGSVTTSPAIAHDGTILIGADCLYALRDDGALLWKYLTPAVVSGSPAIGADGTVYVASIDGSLHAVSPSGARRWSVKFANSGTGSSPSLDASGTVYIGTIEHTVLAFNADGTQRWRIDGGGVFAMSSPVIGPGGRLYIGCWDKKIYAIR